jgi:hypothetical protein
VKWQRSKFPDDVRRQLSLRDRERILAWADDGAGRLVVASELALHLQRNPPEYSRIGWDQIERAGYDGGVMAITLIPELSSSTLRVPVGAERELPVVIRDRVTASVVVDRFVPLVNDRGVRIVGRRSDHGIRWRTDLDPEIAEDQQCVNEAQRLLAEAQAEVATN